MNSSFENSSLTSKTKYKIVFLGDMAVGKSSIIERFMKGCFNERHNSTVAIDFLAKNVYYREVNYRLQLWDTGGQERFKSLIPAYLKDASCAVFIFDVANRESFNNIKSWVQIFQDNKPQDAAVIMLGNKIDLPRKVSALEAREQAKILNMPYYQVSAKTAENIQKFFEEAIDIMKECTGSTEAQSQNQHNPNKSISKHINTSEKKLRQGPKKVQQTSSSYRKKECCYI